jgi:hypothetical protein
MMHAQPVIDRGGQHPSATAYPPLLVSFANCLAAVATASAAFVTKGSAQANGMGFFVVTPVPGVWCCFSIHSCHASSNADASSSRAFPYSAWLTRAPERK